MISIIENKKRNFFLQEAISFRNNIIEGDKPNNIFGKLNILKENCGDWSEYISYMDIEFLNLKEINYFNNIVMITSQLNSYEFYNFEECYCCVECEKIVISTTNEYNHYRSQILNKLNNIIFSIRYNR